MPLYDLPIWAVDTYKFPADGIRGVGWKLTAVEVPYAVHGSKAWESHFHSIRERYPGYSVNNISFADTIRIAPQIIAETNTRLSAQTTLELLLTSLSILDGNLALDLEDGLAVPRDRSHLEDLTSDDVLVASRKTMSRDNIVIGAEIAAALSRRQFLKYCAFKLKLSYEIASVHWMAFHPRYSPKEFAVTRSLSSHGRMASAITLAYSAIEELQMEPRPIKNKQVKAAGAWNPDALQDLQDRLRAAHVDLSKTQIWSVRGSQTRIHSSARSPQGSKTPWTKGVVRDRSVQVEDALVAASWIRSKCSTHKYQPQTRSITMYDVNNVQNLARRLLLERTKFWTRLTSPA